MANRRKGSVQIKAGDVFAMSLPNGKLGYGQVIVGGVEFYVAVFRQIFDSPPELDELFQGDILFVGWTTDALIYHGHWQLVGNRPPISDRVPFPTYKVRINGVPHIHDFNGENRRPASPENWELLDYHSSHAPIRYQNALLAHHGLGEWKDYYDEITVEHACRRVLGESNPSERRKR